MYSIADVCMYTYMYIFSIAGGLHELYHIMM